MARILSHPFRLTPNGAVAAVEQDSEAADVEQVAVLVLTRLGERPLVPGFGIGDPTFAGVEPAEVAAGIATYGPPVRLGAIEPRWVDGTTQVVDVRFE